MKQKTKKALQKRFKITGSGKILRSHAYSSHLKRKKTKRRIRRQKEPIVVSAEAKKKVKKLIGKSR